MIWIWNLEDVEILSHHIAILLQCLRGTELTLPHSPLVESQWINARSLLLHILYFSSLEIRHVNQTEEDLDGHEHEHEHPNIHLFWSA